MSRVKLPPLVRKRSERNAADEALKAAWLAKNEPTRGPSTTTKPTGERDDEPMSTTWKKDTKHKSNRQGRVGLKRKK